jgi:hypothetical protein
MRSCDGGCCLISSILFARYTADSIRRLATETVLPYLMHEWAARSSSSSSSPSSSSVIAAEVHKQNNHSSSGGSRGKKGKSQKKKKKSAPKGSQESSAHGDETSPGGAGSGSGSGSDAPRALPDSVAKQFVLDDYENFDDYLEMVISFG